MGHGRGKAFKQNKKIDPFEIYESDPTVTPDEERVVAVYFPVR